MYSSNRLKGCVSRLLAKNFPKIGSTSQLKNTNPLGLVNFQTSGNHFFDLRGEV